MSDGVIFSTHIFPPSSHSLSSLLHLLSDAVVVVVDAADQLLLALLVERTPSLGARQRLICVGGKNADGGASRGQHSTTFQKKKKKKEKLIDRSRARWRKVKHPTAVWYGARADSNAQAEDTSQKK